MSQVVHRLGNSCCKNVIKKLNVIITRKFFTLTNYNKNRMNKID